MAKGAKRSVNIYVNSKNVEESINQLNKTLKQNEKEWKNLAAGTREYYEKAKEIAKLKKIIDQHNQDIMTAERRMEQWRRKWMDIGAGLGGFVQTINMIKQGLQVFRDMASELALLDDKMHLVKKTTGLSIKSIQEMNKELSEIDTRTSIEDLDELAYAAGKLGKNSKEDVLGFVKAADQINVALGDVLGGTDAIIEIAKMTEIFADGVQELQNAPIEKRLLAIGSVINELGKTSTANEKHMTEFMGRLAGVAGQLGVTVDQVAGYASVFDQYKQKVEMSATAMQRMFQEMIKKPEEFAKAASMSLKEFQQLMDEDFNQAVIRVLKGFSKAGGMQALVPAFKEMGLDGQRATQAIASLASHVDKLEEAQATANQAMKEAVSVTKEYATMNESMQAEIEKGQKRIAAARRELGEKLYPIIVKFISLRGRFIKFISGLTDKKVSIGAILAASAAILTSKIMPALNEFIEKVKKSKIGVDLATIAHRKEIIALEQKKIEIAKNTKEIIKERTERLKSIGASKLTKKEIEELNTLKAKEIILNEQIEKSQKKIANASVWKFMKNHWAAIVTILISIVAYIGNIIQEQAKLKKAVDETTVKMKEEQKEAKSLFTALQNANTSLQEKEALMKIINDKYGEYLKNLRNEKGELNDIATAMAIVNTRLREKWKIEAYNKGVEVIDDEYNGKIEKYYGKIYDQLFEKTNSQEVTSIILHKLEEMMDKGIQMTKTRTTDDGKTYRILSGEVNKLFEKYGLKPEKTIKADVLHDWAVAEIEKRNALTKLQSKYGLGMDEYAAMMQRQKEIKIEKEKEIKAYSTEAELLYYDYFTRDIEQKTKEELETYKAQLEEFYKQANKENTVNLREYLGAVKLAQYNVEKRLQMMKKEGDETQIIPDFSEGDGKEAQKIEDKWQKILERIADLNEKYKIKESPISAAKQQIMSDFAAISIAIDRFVEETGTHIKDAQEEQVKLREEMWRQIERIDEEERKKQLQKITEKLNSVEEKMAAWRLKMERKNMTQLEIDLKVIEADWEKGKKEVQEQIEKLQKQSEAAKYISSIYSEDVDKEDFQKSKKQEIEWLEEYGITLDKLVEWIKEKKMSLKEILEATKTGLNEEERQTLDQLKNMIDKLNGYSAQESWSRTLDAVRTTGYQVMSEGRRVREQQEYEITQMIREMEIAGEEAVKRGETAVAETIDKIIENLKKKKDKIWKQFDTSINGFFGISDEDWKDWEYNWQDNLEKITSVVDNVADYIMNVVDLVNQYESMKMEEQLEKIQENYDRRAEVLDKQLNSGLISQKYHDAELEKMEEEKENKEKQLKHSQFERERAASLATIAIQGAVGIARIWAESGANVILAGILTALESASIGIQTAIVAGQANPYYKGGYVKGEQIMLAGERGPEWVASNKLLRDKKTAPVITALENYQRGKTKDFRIIPGGVDRKNVATAAQEISKTITVETDKESLHELRLLRKYLEDPRNRRAVIDRKIMLQFEENEKQLKNRANI